MAVHGHRTRWEFSPHSTLYTLGETDDEVPPHRGLVSQGRSPTAVEYAVMLALIVVVCFAAITAIGGASNQTFSQVGSAITPS